MYKKYILILVLFSLIPPLCVVNVKTLQVNRALCSVSFREYGIEEKFGFIKFVQVVSSGRRCVNYEVMECNASVVPDKESYEILCRIVEAEAGCEDRKGKRLVANVVLNRVESELFPNSIKEVVFQRSNGITQFSPVSDGRYGKVEISEETKQAVDEVLQGKDESEGALFFVNRKYADPERVKWFDRACTSLFVYGHHEFFI